MAAAIIAAVLGVFGLGDQQRGGGGIEGISGGVTSVASREESTSRPSVVPAVPEGSGRPARIWFEREYLEAVREQGMEQIKYAILDRTNGRPRPLVPDRKRIQREIRARVTPLTAHHY
jgi:hypothetical protein